MLFYSTNQPSDKTDFKTAVLQGLPADNGLYMPESIPDLGNDFWEQITSFSFQELSEILAQSIISGSIPENDLRQIVHDAISFPAPVVQLDESTAILELTHGPSLAFKDFGARFMARVMSYFNQGSSKKLIILVATSGDTGGAVAAGFFNTPGIEVVILYPEGKVSELQEKQLTTWGGNISAVEVKGTFDDCQSMVKQAFLDVQLRSVVNISSANSINISRLIPQIFYYAEAFKQLKPLGRDLVFTVPCGNFGNLTAGLMAKRMGMPVKRFIAATNINKVVPDYLLTGDFQPQPSKRTLSNAMDVGNPSNFVRILDLYGSTWNNIKEDILGFAFDDASTEEAMRAIHAKYGYTIDPHGAVGYLAFKQWEKTTASNNSMGVILETAHPAKFLEDTERILNKALEMPEGLKLVAKKEKKAEKMDTQYQTLKSYLLDHYR